MAQQITRGDYLKDLITIYVENNLQTDITELYSEFIFQCGDIQKTFEPAPVIKVSFNEQESLKLKNLNTCYMAGITVEGHKETFQGSLSFNTRGEVVYYEPAASTITPSGTSSTCDCQGIRGFYSNCSQPAIKAYFSLNYVPTKLSELTNDTDFVDSVDVAESISIHNASTEAHPYIQGLIENEVSVRASQTEALAVSIQAETTAREEAISLAISTTEGYADSILSAATTEIDTTIGDLDNLDTAVKSSVVNAINSEVSARESADNNLQEQIDALSAASDVTDIVGTYQDLQNYDTQHLNDNDIIKVLSDSTHNGAPSYYRFDKDTDTFSYIGSEAETYTKAESNSIFVAQTTEVNGHALSSDINLTASDIGALADSYATVISANTSAIASNTSVIAQHTTAIASNTNAIGTLQSLDTVDKSNLVGAINEVLSIADPTQTTDYINNSKAVPSGEVSTNSIILADVKNYAHSTFDASKFTVVGTPNITDDGIVSNLNNSKYIKKTNLPLSGNTLIIKGTYLWNGTNPTGSSEICKIWTSSSENLTFYQKSDGKVELFRRTGGTDNYNIGSYSISANVNLVYTITVVKNTSISFVAYQDGIKVIDKTVTNAIPSIFTNSNILSFGGAYSAVTQGSIDLKQFSITVDGVPVFSGNKTGIDTIKPDDYTVVGTPTISADGVASGFSSSNYVTKNLSLTSGTITKVRIPFYFGSTLTDVNQAICTLYDSSNAVLFRLAKASSYSALAFYQSSTFGDAYPLNDITIDTTAHYIFELTGDTSVNKTYIKLFKNGEEVALTQTEFNTTANYSNSVTAYLGEYSSWAGFEGSINLNAFKIYVDGNLVYQPCIKIPYTFSKTGSKIVNSVYRPRVNDMAEQFGFANYYTLSDTDFTLPQVELYGLIGQKTLRYSYENGINKVELFSNRDLTQQGSCTSGVEVTFLRPFADTNYILTVPYSAKSATAFTPTQTGDWKAEGKGWF